MINSCVVIADAKGVTLSSLTHAAGVTERLPVLHGNAIMFGDAPSLYLETANKEVAFLPAVPGKHLA